MLSFLNDCCVLRVFFLRAEGEKKMKGGAIYNAFVLVLGALYNPVSLWICWKTYAYSKQVYVKQTKSRSAKPKSKATNSKIKRVLQYLSQPKVFLGSHVTAAVLVYLVSLTILTFYVIKFIRMARGPRQGERVFPKMMVTFGTGLTSVAYALLMFIYVQRTASTFKDMASLRLSDEMVFSIHCLSLISLMVALAGSIGHAFDFNQLTFICFALAAPTYVCVSCFVVYQFFRRTMLVIVRQQQQQPEADIQLSLSHIPSVTATPVSGFSAPGTNLNNEDVLLHAAVRVSICAFLSLMSNIVIMAVVCVITTQSCSWCWSIVLLMFVVITLVDSCINQFTLMCTFRASEQYYERVLGGLHRCVIAYITGQAGDKATRN